MNYEDMVKNCCSCENPLEDLLASIAQEIVNLVGNTKDIQNDLIKLAKLIADNNNCIVPCDDAENILCINDNLCEINCIATDMAQCLRLLVCNLLTNK